MDELVVCPHAGNGHFVLGQCAGFVGTDCSGGTKCLHRRQFSDERMALYHFAHTKREGDGYDSGQTFRHGSDCKADGNDEYFGDLCGKFFQVIQRRGE